jgi:hypothetical protein
LGCHLQNANDAETLKLWKAVEVATNKYLQAESKVTAKEEKKVFVYIPPWKALFTETLICWQFQHSQIMLSSCQANFLIFLSLQIERIFLGLSERS